MCMRVYVCIVTPLVFHIRHIASFAVIAAATTDIVAYQQARSQIAAKYAPKQQQ